MKKKLAPLAVFVLVVMMLTATAQAAVMRSPTATPSLSFSGGKASCSATCTADTRSDSIAATLTLYQGNTVVGSWDNSGTYRVRVSGSANATSGKSYKLVLTWSVNGKSQTSVSKTKTCP